MRSRLERRLEFRASGLGFRVERFGFRVRDISTV